MKKAKEWEVQGNDESFVLRGKGLEAAEAMLNQEAEKEPKLTPLKREYIFASTESARQNSNLMPRIDRLATSTGSAQELASAPPRKLDSNLLRLLKAYTTMIALPTRRPTPLNTRLDRVIALK